MEDQSMIQHAYDELNIQQIKDKLCKYFIDCKNCFEVSRQGDLICICCDIKKVPEIITEPAFKLNYRRSVYDNLYSIIKDNMLVENITTLQYSRFRIVCGTKYIEIMIPEDCIKID